MKHGLVLSYYCLLKSADISEDKLFDFAMRQVTRLGGDTNTNCSIVGGMIGAYIGASTLPQDKIRRLLNCDTSLATNKAARNRPSHFDPTFDSI